MQNEELEKKVHELLTTTELSHTEIAKKFGTSRQKVEAIKRKLQVPLGDKVEKFTKATGIKKVVDTAAKLLNKDCGCKARKDNLNSIDIAGLRLKVVNHPTESDVDEIYTLLNEQRTGWDRPTRERIERMRSKIFNVRYSVISCASCGVIYTKRLNELKRVFDAYTEPA